MSEGSSWKRKIAGLAAGLGIYAAVHDKPEAKSVENKPVPVTQEFHKRENLESLPPLMTSKERAKSEQYDQDYEASVKQKKIEQAWAAQEAAQKYIPTEAQKQIAEQKYAEIADMLKNDKGWGQLTEFPIGGNLNEFCKNLDQSETFFSRDKEGVLHVQRFEGVNEDGTPKIGGMMDVQIEPQEDGTNEYHFSSAEKFGEDKVPLFEELITDPNEKGVSSALFRYYAGSGYGLDENGMTKYEREIDSSKSNAEIIQDLNDNIYSINSLFRTVDDDGEGHRFVELNSQARIALNERIQDYQEQLDDMKKHQAEEQIVEM